MIRFVLVAGGMGALLFGCLWWQVSRMDPMSYLNSEYPAWAAKMTLAAGPQGGKVVILGDSRAMAGLIPAEIDPRVINLALSGGSAMEAYFMARRVLCQPEKPAMVLLSIGPDHLAYIDFSERGGSFGFLASSEMREVARKGLELQDPELGSNWPFAFDKRLEAWLLPRHFPSYYITALRQSRVGRRGPGNRRAYEGVLAQRGLRILKEISPAPGTPIWRLRSRSGSSPRLPTIICMLYSPCWLNSTRLSISCVRRSMKFRCAATSRRWWPG